MNEKPTEENNFFFYGSLRKGDYNHSIIDDKNPKAFATITGFKMYSLGSYPFIVETKNEEDTVFGEIYTNLTQNEIDYIDRMELGAGYRRKLGKVTADNGKEYEIVIYTQDYEGVVPHTPVDDGDWLKFKKKE